LSATTHEQALFAAQAFAARLAREMGITMSPAVKDQVLFAYEMGYLRGCSDTLQTTTKMFETTTKEGKDNDGKSS